MYKKRGISPLISAVLLIGFSVALAAIVSTFVIEKTKEFDVSGVVSSSYCEEVTLAVGVQGNTFSMDGGLVQYLNLVNKGSFAIHQLSYTAPGMNSQIYQFYSVGSPAPLAPGMSMAYTFSYGAVEGGMFKFVPWIMDPETLELVPCDAQQLEVSFATMQGFNGG